MVVGMGDIVAQVQHRAPLHIVDDIVHDIDLERSLARRQPRRRVIENKHWTRIGARLSLSVCAHADARTHKVVFTSVECLFSITPPVLGGRSH